MESVGALLVDQRTAASMLGISVSTLRRWQREGRGPRAIRVSRLIRYRPEDLRQALRQVEILCAAPDLSARCRAAARAHFDLYEVGGVRYRRLYERLLPVPALPAAHLAHADAVREQG